MIYIFQNLSGESYSPQTRYNKRVYTAIQYGFKSIAI